MIVTKIRVFPLILNLKCGKLLASLNHPNGLCGMSASQISVSTPEVLWHGGGNENGKPDPVYSVDFHPQEHIMCTSGIDANVPPKGSVRIWRVGSGSGGQEFLLDLCDHQSAVNVARFSPDGKMLASASDRQIVVYVVESPSVWNHIADVVPLERLWLRPALNEVFDIQWSPDSTHLVVGAIDCKAEIIHLSSRDSLMLPGHTSYIQGVAWDPRGEHVVTQSADRSCKVHKIKSRGGAMVKLAPRGHVVMRMHQGYTVPDSAKKVLTAADFGITTQSPPTGGVEASASAVVAVSTPSASGGDGANASGDVAAAPASAGVNLFADSYVPSFFRRVSCSPDGALVIAPTGIHHPPANKAQPATSAGKTAPVNSNSFCTHLFSRDNLASPCLSLVGLEEPSIAVRCFARPYKLIQHPSGSAQGGATGGMIAGDYRFVFAVVTLGSVFIYDTQHAHPIAKFAGLHYAPINDAAWSEDGRVLAVCSSDGYLSFFRFEPGALGELLDESLVPEVIKKAHPCLFHYVPPVVAEDAKAATAEADCEQDAEAEAEAEPVVEGAATEGAAAEGAAGQGVSGQTATTIATAAVDAKKRKRIQPMVVSAVVAGESVAMTSGFGSAGASSSVTVVATMASSDTGTICPTSNTSATLPCATTTGAVDQAVTCGIPTEGRGDNAVAAGASASGDASVEKKQKKRIVPQSLSSHSATTSTASSSVGETAGVEVL